MRGKVFLRTRHYENDEEKPSDRYDERYERQTPFRHEHHDKTTDELRDSRNDRRQSVRQPLLQSRDVVRYAAQNIALRVHIEIFLRNAVDLLREFAAHTVRHFQRDRRHYIMLNECEKRAQPVNDDQRDPDLRDRGEIYPRRQSFGHQIRYLTDLIRTDYRQDRPECRQNERECDDPDAAFDISGCLSERRHGSFFARQRSPRSSLYRSHTAASSPLFVSPSSFSLSCDRAI